MKFKNYLVVILLVAFTGIASFMLGHKSGQQESSGALSAPVQAEQKKAPDASEQIEIQDAYIQSAGIKVEQASSGDITTEILAPAKVTSIPGGEAILIAKAAGIITQIKKRLGDSVQAGETIAVLDSMEASRMSAERTKAYSELELAKKVYERKATLFEHGVTAKQDVDTAQSALAVAEAEAVRSSQVMKAAHLSNDGRSLLVVSPLTGKITAETAIVGSFVQPDSQLFRVADSKQLQVEAFITASDLIKVKPGDSATIVGRNGVNIPASVRSITPAVDGGNQIATAILTPEKDHSELVIGEGLQVRLHKKSESNTYLVIPEDAIQNLDGRDVVFIKTNKGFKPQPVVVGVRTNGKAQVVSGIEPKTEIATQNAFLIKAEMIKNSAEEE